MANDSWECQGRQQHGYFGSGTCAATGGGADSARDAGGCPRCEVEHLAYGAVGVLAPSVRQGYENWLSHGGLNRLQEIVPQWVGDATLDPASFRSLYFGPVQLARDILGNKLQDPPNGATHDSHALNVPLSVIML